MTGEKPDAVAALTRLGFTEYQAKVFIALQQLGTGTARDVHRITDVPRSQVYGVAEELEADGLVNVQRSTPREYRPISPAEAKALLSTQFERDLDAAIEYLEGVERSQLDEKREDIWTVRGREAIGNRIVQLADGAAERVVFGASDESLLSTAIERTLRERAAEGVEVTVISSVDAVRARFADAGGVSAIRPPADVQDDEHTGRLLVVDRDTVLHSVIGEEELPGINRETAYWSSESGFASTLVSLMERMLSEETGE